MEWRRFVTYLSNDRRIFQKKMNCKSEVANSTALYHATNNSSEHRAVMSDSCALLSVTEQVVYSVQIVGDSHKLAA